jgi:hypothetical protein
MTMEADNMSKAKSKAELKAEMEALDKSLRERFRSYGWTEEQIEEAFRKGEERFGKRRGSNVAEKTTATPKKASR